MAIAPRAQRGGTSAPGQSAPSLPANFGQGELSGEALDRLTGAVAGYVGQIRSRQDTIEAARIRQQFSEFSQAELVRLSSEQDFSREETFNAYKASLINRKRDLITNAPLTGNGRAKVDAELTNILGVGVAEAAQMRVAEQNRVVATALNQQMGEIMASISADPSAPLTDRLLQVDDLIRGYAPALTPEKEAALRTAATGQVVEAYMQPLVEAADTEGLRAMLDDPTVRNALGPEQYRTLSTQLRVQEVAKAQEAAQRAATVERLRAAGVDVSNPRIALALEKFNPAQIFPQAPTNPQVAQWEAMVASGMDPAEAWNRVAPLPGAEGGGSLGTGQERNEALLTTVGDAVVNAPPGETPMLSFKQVTDAIGEVERRFREGRNDVTGTFATPSIPPSMRLAMEAGGVTLDMIAQDTGAAAVQMSLALGVPLPVRLDPSRQPGALPPEQGGPTIPMIGAQLPPKVPTTPGAGANMAAPDAEGVVAAIGEMAPLFEPATEEDAQELGTQVATQYQTALATDGQLPAPAFNLYDAAPFVTGPDEAISAYWNRFNPIGTPRETAQRALASRQFATLAFMGMVNGMRQSPRYAVAEYQDMVNRLAALSPGQFFSNPGAYRALLEGTSNYIVQRLNFYQNQLERSAEAERAGQPFDNAETTRQNKGFVRDMEFALEVLGVHNPDGTRRVSSVPTPEVGTGGTFTDADAQRMREIEDRLREMGVPVP